MYVFYLHIDISFFAPPIIHIRLALIMTQFKIHAQAVLQIFKPGGNKAKSTTKQSAGPLSKAKASMKLLAGLAIPALSLSSPLLDAPRAFAAEDRRQVADIPASGIIFKDSINIEAFRDPKVSQTQAVAYVNRALPLNPTRPHTTKIRSMV